MAGSLAGILRLSINILAAAALCSAFPLSAHAAAEPTPVTTDLWDISQGITITANSSTLSDIRNMFGGAFGPAFGCGCESEHTLFRDGLPAGTMHFVEWRTLDPITLRSFHLFAVHDGPPFDARYRGFSRFVLYAKRSGSDSFEQIHEFSPSNPYGGGEQGSFLTLAANVASIEAQEFRAEFVQYGDIEPRASGPRIIELDGFGEALPSERNPIVLVPALLTSFNYQALLRDREGGAWRFVPLFGNLYQGLIERFEGAGYEEGKDLVVAHYDWRQPIAESALEYLMPAIDAVQESSSVGPDGKVDVVAHSMGGLVARQYIRSAQYRDDVDQLILIGTPNEGAADVYVAWEGGEFPERWGARTKAYVNVVELALKVARGVDADPPQSFRILFPALKDLLPIDDFVKRDGSLASVSELTEQNLFLRRLRDDFDLLTQRVRVQTIVGDRLSTLEHVLLDSERSAEDIAVERWRDGHPNPDPPQTDTTAGDQTVLLSSAILGANPVILPNVLHVRLPEEAQEETLEALGLDVGGSHIAYEQPDSVLGVLTLSPVNPSLTCNGQTLSNDTNTFVNAEFIADDGDPNGPKLLVIGDPPAGECTLRLLGTGDGPYTVVTVFADEDETMTTTQEGVTAPDQEDQITLVVTEDGFRPSAQALLALAQKLKDTVHQLKRDQHILGSENGQLVARANNVFGPAQAYERTGVEKHYERLREAVTQFEQELTQRTAQGNLDSVAILELAGLHHELESTGL